MIGAAARAQPPSIYVQQGPNNVTALAVSADSRLAATGVRGVGGDAVRLYDLVGRRELRMLRHYEVQSIAFSPDGRWLATAGKEEKQERVEGLSGVYLASRYSVRLWDVATGELARTVEKQDTAFGAFAFSPDGRTLAVGDGRPAVRLYDVSGVAASAPRPLNGKAGTRLLAFSPDGATLAAASSDNSVVLWDAAGGTQRHVLMGHSKNVEALSFSADGALLASGGRDEKLRLWDAKRGEPRGAFEGLSSVKALAFTRDGSAVKVASLDGARSLNLKTKAVSKALKPISGGTHVAAFSPGGGLLISYGLISEVLAVTDTDTGTEVHRFEKRAGEVCALTASSVNETPVLVVETYGETRLWNLKAGEYVGSAQGNLFCNALGVLSPDQKLFAAPNNQNIALLDPVTKNVVRTLPANQQFLGVSSVAFSPDGKRLAAGGMDSVTKVWDVETGALVSSIKTSAGPQQVKIPGTTLTVTDPGTMFPRLMLGMAFSPDGRTLAGGFSEPVTLANVVGLWDTATGRELRRLKGHEDSISDVAFSADGSLIASGDSAGVVKIWEAATGKDRHTLAAHDQSVSSLLFIPEGTLLTAGGGVVKMWDVSTGAEVLSLITLGMGDWLVATPGGLFDGSPSAWNEILWRFSPDTWDVAPVEIFFSEYFYPNLLADTLVGKRPSPPADIRAKDRRQPRVNIALAKSPATAAPSAARNVKVRVEVTSAVSRALQVPGGIRDVRLFRNGSLVRAWRGDLNLSDGRAVLEVEINVAAGENRLSVYAFNQDNIKSGDAVLTVTGPESLKRKGTAYVLAVGVNEYANPQYNLKYAVADAQLFGGEVKRQLERLGAHDRVEVIPLHDGRATKENILGTLRRLSEEAQPEDAVLVFFAGHGTASGDRFYLIPHDLNHKGERGKLGAANLKAVLASSISDEELERAFEGVGAEHVMLVIDACNSGQALEAEEKRRGPMNSKGLAQLAYEKGMYVLTASQSFQAAIEASRLGHGLLTYALVEQGLRQGKADAGPRDGAVVAREWLSYAAETVPGMQEEEMVTALRGRNLRLAFVEGDEKVDDPAKRGVQRPRVFYRREAESRPLVIAKPSGIEK